MSELSRKIEALLFISPSPVTEKELKEALNVSAREITLALDELGRILDGENHGISLRMLSGGWVLETKPELSDVTANFRADSRSKHIRLSRAAIETITVIAHKQPVTRSEIDDIRGVNSASPVARLLELGLIRTAGRKKEGRPSLLYATTPKFFEVFGINDMSDIPAIDEIDIQQEE